MVHRAAAAAAAHALVADFVGHGVRVAGCEAEYAAHTAHLRNQTEYPGPLERNLTEAEATLQRQDAEMAQLDAEYQAAMRELRFSAGTLGRLRHVQRGPDCEM